MAGSQGTAAKLAGASGRGTGDLSPGDPRPASIQSAAVSERQALKLKAVAELAPSIAHDFNNLMMVVSARTLLAHASVHTPDKISIHLQAIDQASERAREMARSLLGLVRQEVVEWGPVDLSSLVMEFVGLLRRLLPPEVRVRTELPRNPVVLEGCADMLRQMLLHIAVRAWSDLRDGSELLFVVAPPGGEDGVLGHSWLRLSVLHESQRLAEGSDGHTSRSSTTDTKSMHLHAIRTIVAEHSGAVSQQPLDGLVKLDVLLPKRSSHASIAPEAPSNPDRWLLLVSSDSSVQERVTEAIVATGWSLVTVPSVDSPQVRPGFSQQRPSGVILDLASVKPEQLPPHLAQACRDVPCLVVNGQGRAERGARTAEPQRTGRNGPRAGGGFAGTGGLSDPGTETASGARDAWHEQPLDRQVVQRWVDHVSRSVATTGGMRR